MRWLLLRRWRGDFHAAEERIDRSLTLLLVIQAITLFVVIPIGRQNLEGRLLSDLCHFAFASVCVVALLRRRMVQAALLFALALLVGAPLVEQHLPTALRLDRTLFIEMMSLVAFFFNALVTTIVARHVFASGRVTGHRLQGAVLVYLNVAALFSIMYSALDVLAPGAIAQGSGALLPQHISAHTAALSYFSLETITSTGYGDIVPVDPIARSLASLEAVFGHLFPATLMARLVALHVSYRGEGQPTNSRLGETASAETAEAKPSLEPQF